MKKIITLVSLAILLLAGIGGYVYVTKYKYSAPDVAPGAVSELEKQVDAASLITLDSCEPPTQVVSTLEDTTKTATMQKQDDSNCFFDLQVTANGSNSAYDCKVEKSLGSVDLKYFRAEDFCEMKPVQQ